MRVWITPDKAWRVEIKPDGKFTIVQRSMPVAAGRGGLAAARAALTRLPDAPTWSDLIED